MEILMEEKLDSPIQLAMCANDAYQAAVSAKNPETALKWAKVTYQHAKLCYLPDNTDLKQIA